MWYWILGIVAAVYVGWDAHRRGNNPWGWAIVAVPFWPLSLPIYRAERFLLAGEKRIGGTAWVAIKGFVVIWQVLCLVWLISYYANVGKIETNSEYGAAGVALGSILGTGFIVGIWVAVTLIAFVVGMFVKEDTVEEGPTGPKHQGRLPH